MVTEVKISELPAASSANGTMEFEANDSGVSKKVTGSQLQTFIQSGVPTATNGLFINNQTVSTSYTIPSGYSAMSSGPITVASGQSVTVPSGSRWVVV